MKIGDHLPVIMVFWFVLLLAAPVAAATAAVEKRELFLQAERALQEKQYAQYNDILPQLQDYPLYPYLLYRDLRLRLATATNKEFSHFFRSYADTPLAPLLRNALLKYLAKKKH